jgi:hypothetical protein
LCAETSPYLAKPFEEFVQIQQSFTQVSYRRPRRRARQFAGINAPFTGVNSRLEVIGVKNRTFARPVDDEVEARNVFGETQPARAHDASGGLL